MSNVQACEEVVHPPASCQSKEAARASVVVDTNAHEDSLATMLQNLGLDVLRTRLDVGDVLVSSSDTKIYVERKTWQDFRASIIDGRYADQKARMLTDGSEKELFVYVIEGAKPRWDEVSNTKMSGKCLLSATAKMQLRDGIAVFTVEDTQETAFLIEYLFKNCSAGFERRSHVAIHSGVKRRKRENTHGTMSVLTNMLTAVDGISYEKASALVEKYACVQSLCNVTHHELSNFKVGSRRIGEKVASRLKEVFRESIPTSTGTA